MYVRGQILIVDLAEIFLSSTALKKPPSHAWMLLIYHCLCAFYLSYLKQFTMHDLIEWGEQGYFMLHSLRALVIIFRFASDKDLTVFDNDIHEGSEAFVLCDFWFLATFIPMLKIAYTIKVCWSVHCCHKKGHSLRSLIKHLVLTRTDSAPPEVVVDVLWQYLVVPSL